jgi:hypothetical protein
MECGARGAAFAVDPIFKTIYSRDSCAEFRFHQINFGCRL